MKVWVTRDELPREGPLSKALHQAGLEAVCEPVIERQVVYDARAEIEALGENDWLVLTSVFAVGAIGDPPVIRCKVAVVGEATKRAAEAKGLRVEHLSQGGDARSLFEELAAKAIGRTVCYPRSSQAKLPGPEFCEGVSLVSPITYETTTREYRRSVINDINVIAVTSPSAVRAIGVVDKPYGSIGPTTTAALRELGIEPWVEAPVKNFTSLAQAIADQA